VTRIRRPCGPCASRRSVQSVSQANQCGGCPVRALQVTVASQRPEGEEKPVAMIAQVEDPRETHCRVGPFLPAAILLLCRQEKVDTPHYGFAVDLAHSHEPEERPGGL